jgi:hypothetical protein
MKRTSNTKMKTLVASREPYNPCKPNVAHSTYTVVDQKPKGLAASSQSSLDKMFNSWMEEFEDKTQIQAPSEEYFDINDEILFEYGFNTNELDLILDYQLCESDYAELQAEIAMEQERQESIMKKSTHHVSDAKISKQNKTTSKATRV